MMMMKLYFLNLFMGKVNSYTIILLLLIYLLIVLYSLVLIFKRETRFRFLISVLVVLFVPLLEPLAYIVFYYATKMSKE